MREWARNVNLFYMLCYAWDRGEQVDAIDVGEIGPHDQVADLLARILVGAVEDLLRRGLDRDYEDAEEELTTVRGRIQFGSSVRRFSLPRGRVVCRYDELTSDVLQNRLIRATLARLSAVEGLKPSVRSELKILWKRLEGIADSIHSVSDFVRVRIHGNNRHYGFLLLLCQFAWENTLVDDRTGNARFVGFDKVADLDRIFERFIRRFYQREAPWLKVQASKMPWRPAIGSSEDTNLLPEMRTDIVVRAPGRTIVIDTKLTDQVLQRDPYSGKETIRSGHLYQIYSYVQNLSRTEGPRVEGMLLYPEVDRPLSVRVSIHGFDFRIQTVDLTSDWKSVHDSLLGLMPARREEPSSATA